jgi:hypothetical protein
MKPLPVSWSDLDLLRPSSTVAIETIQPQLGNEGEKVGIDLIYDAVR